MAKQSHFNEIANSLRYTIICLVLFLLLGLNQVSSNLEEYKTYIIHMDHSHKPEIFSTEESWHQNVLQSLPPFRSDDKEKLVYSYSHAMHGFSALLTPSQLSQLEKLPSHLATYEESFGNLFTTHSPKFLGLSHNAGIWPTSSYGKNVIIGLVDTGIWPESQSFNDKGMSPVPARWKGTCENGTAFSHSLCNRKLIGARSFSKGLVAAGGRISKDHDFKSARDFEGHGTHTSSTAAGNYALGASHFGYASGTARGVAPTARIAMYKVAWAHTLGNIAASDLLAAMDQSIVDGVDILSLSLGLAQAPYFKDVLAIAALSATEKGISVVCAAGNFGPDAYSIFNGAPWITTVGAGTIDRKFVAMLQLGNGETVEGISYFPESIYITDSLLYYGKSNVNKSICRGSALDPKEVAGKVVLCDTSTTLYIDQQMDEIVRVGAYAGILLTDTSATSEAYADSSIPYIFLPINSGGTTMREYAKAASKPMVRSMRFVITRIGTKPAPQVYKFSSRGPNPITPSILKPDILAPGVDVLAAVTPNNPSIRRGIYNLVTDYALLTGTSMAAPHVAGVTALLKAVHHDWSPAAIRSALMTTATTTDNTHANLKDQVTGLSASPLDFGAGHVNPNKAMEPGLIYDMDSQDYVEFLCGLNYTKRPMSSVLRRNNWSCSQKHTNLNYPSFVAIFPHGASSHAGKNFSRIVTNVGDDETIYRAILEVQAGRMRIKVEPSTLEFTSKNQRRSFILSVEVDKDAPRTNYGYLKWTDQTNHTVSSPVVAIHG